MAILYGSSSGGSLIASVLSERVYDPVFDTEMDAEFIWQLLPSFYKNLMDDREIFTKTWSGVMQAGASDLLNLWQSDYSKSLRDVPVISQRKWIYFDLSVQTSFEEDPGLTIYGLPGIYAYRASEQDLQGSWQNRARVDKATLALRGTVDQDTSLSWSVCVNVTSVEKRGSALFGYLSSQKHPIGPSLSDQMADALCAGVVGDATTANTPRLFLVHASPIGVLTFSKSAVNLKVGTDYRIDASYTARTKVVVASAVEVRAQKLLGTGGYTEGSIGEVATNLFTDSSTNFDLAGVVPGDILLTLGQEFEIVSVDGFTLTTKTIGLPVDVSGLSYEIQGEVLITSISLDLEGDAPDPTFTCDTFGTSTLDMRSGLTSLFSSPASGLRKSLLGSTWKWSCLDPTVAETLLSIPRLQDSISEPSILLYEGTDYRVGGSTIRFQEPPGVALWAEYVGYDERYIDDNFGSNVGLSDASSDQYKARVRGLYYSFFQGPTVSAIRTGVHILVGLPIAEAAGTVESINPAYSGEYGVITVSGRDYLYPLIVGTSLSVGESVDLFQPLTLGVGVVDYLNDADWFVGALSNEIFKYHTFQVELNVDAFDLSTLGFVSNFVTQIKPTWKDFVFLVYKSLQDDVDLQDDIRLAVTLNLYDAPTEEPPLVRYDSYDYGDGDTIYPAGPSFLGGYPGEVDWRYDQGIASWSSTSAAMRRQSTAISGHVLLTPGSSAVTGVGTSFLSEVGGPGPVLARYMLFGAYSSGTAGQTVSGSHDLVDIVSGFADVLVGDSAEIPGEGTFEVLSITDTVYASGSATFPGIALLTDSAADFISAGVQAGDSVEIFSGLNAGLYSVAAVLSADTLTLSAGVVDPAAAPYEVRRKDRVTLDAPMVSSASALAWSVRGRLSVMCQVVSVTSNTLMTLLTPAPAGAGSAHVARVDNDFRRVKYDQFEEAVPEEELSFVATISAAYAGPLPLAINLPDSQTTTVALSFTGYFGTPGDEVGSTVAEPVV